MLTRPAYSDEILRHLFHETLNNINLQAYGRTVREAKGGNANEPKLIAAPRWTNLLSRLAKRRCSHEIFEICCVESFALLLPSAKFMNAPLNHGIEV